MHRHLAIAMLLLGASCTSFEHVDVENYIAESGLALSTEPPPRDASPLNVVAFHRMGFYLLGFIPIPGVRLEDCVEAIAGHAAELGADGVADLRIEYEPASLIKFAAFPIPDWTASIAITGLAYRLPDNPAYPSRPPGR